ncbi:MAG: hypothetical protein D3918_08670 [Candidatus Electrothrix sp. AX2]|nr:hypothetical protein [Candidatus Electrothrix gigas]
MADKTEDGKFGICGGNLIEWDDGIVIIPEHDETLDVEDQWNGEDQYFKFRFEPSIIPELKTLIKILMQVSPRKEVWFSTDIQFGPSETSEEYTTLERFFNQTEFSELDWHRLYKIKRTSAQTLCEAKTNEI